MTKKLITLLTMAIALSLAACATGGAIAPEDMPSTLIVTDGSSEKTYSVDDLQALPGIQATFNEVTYQGVNLSTLLQDAGFDPAALKAVKAVAADGYSMNYDPNLFQREDVLVAFATADGPLGAEDGVFRMVLPGEEGKLNVRMLAELRVMP